MPRFSLIAWIPFSLTLLLTAGCETTSDIFNLPDRSSPPSSSVAAREAASIRRTEAKVAQIEAQLDELNRLTDRLDRRLDDLERRSHNPNELTALRRDLDALRQDMARQRGEIVNDLAQKLAKMQSARPQPPSPAPRSHAKSGYEHIVEKGQTLSEIARGYGVSVDSILRANNLTRKSVIRVGQKLFIPDAN